MCCHSFWNLHMRGTCSKSGILESRYLVPAICEWYSYPPAPDLPSIKRVKILLYIFELIFRLFINFHKSSIYPLRPPRLDLSTISGVLHCIIGNFPFSYLGLPFKPIILSKADWQPLLDRFDKRLAAWKGHSLFHGGRLILVNSVLSSFPLYFMSFSYLS